MIQSNIYSYAGFWLRFAAHLIDQFIIGFVQLIIFLPAWFFIIAKFLPTGKFWETDHFTSAVNIIHSDEIGVAEFTLAVFIILAFVFLSVIIEWLYYALMESSARQATLGKMVLGIKVTGLNGERVSFGKATGRYFGKILSGLIIGIGYVMAGFTEKKQALHDILSGCLVVRSLPAL